ncbi:MAG: hypothetical protein IK081_15265 [Lachnospiraceae bacterium]|nr:hypothetical protein [Lachnospiraceae bacterium]
MPVKKNSEINEFLILACLIFAGSVVEVFAAIDDVRVFGYSMLILFVLAVVYGVKIISLREWHKGFLVAGILLFLRGIAFAFYVILTIRTGDSATCCIVVAGILSILADLLLGTGMEGVVQEDSNGLKWAWAIWKYAGVMIGIVVTYVSCVCVMKFFSFDYSLDMIKMQKLFLYAFLAYWVFRVIQGILMAITAKVMK